MNGKSEKEAQERSKNIHPAPPKCPKCGGELKSMRCRLDKPERYCTVCRLTFESRE